MSAWRSEPSSLAVYQRLRGAPWGCAASLVTSFVLPLAGQPFGFQPSCVHQRRYSHGCMYQVATRRSHCSFKGFADFSGHGLRAPSLVLMAIPHGLGFPRRRSASSSLATPLPTFQGVLNVTGNMAVRHDRCAPCSSRGVGGSAANRSRNQNALTRLFRSIESTERHQREMSRASQPVQRVQRVNSVESSSTEEKREESYGTPALRMKNTPLQIRITRKKTHQQQGPQRGVIPGRKIDESMTRRWRRGPDPERCSVRREAE